MLMDFKVKQKERGRGKTEVGDKLTYLYLMSSPHFAGCLYCRTMMKAKEQKSLTSLPPKTLFF